MAIVARITLTTKRPTTGPGPVFTSCGDAVPLLELLLELVAVGLVVGVVVVVFGELVELVDVVVEDPPLPLAGFTGIVWVLVVLVFAGVVVAVIDVDLLASLRGLGWIRTHPTNIRAPTIIIRRVILVIDQPRLIVPLSIPAAPFT
jgi:hypothetical protein